jgi:hypothetical protein
MASTVTAWGKRHNTQTLIDASKEVGLEINTEKTKYIVCSSLVNKMQDKVMT